MKIRNLTPHEVNVMGGKYQGVYPPDGLSARLEETFTTDGDGDGEVVLRLGEAEPLPDPVEGTILVVSLLYATARSDRHDMYVPVKPVRDDWGQIIGCEELAKVKTAS